MDEEKAGVEDLLRRGEELLQQTPDENQKEEFRLLLLRLQSQYSAHRVRGIKDSLGLIGIFSLNPDKREIRFFCFYVSIFFLVLFLKTLLFSFMFVGLRS